MLDCETAKGDDGQVFVHRLIQLAENSPFDDLANPIVFSTRFFNDDRKLIWIALRLFNEYLAFDRYYSTNAVFSNGLFTVYQGEKMKTRTSILLTILLALVIVLPTAQAKAQATRIEFTGFELCDPNTMVVPKIWNAGPNLQVRGWSETCSETADSPLMTGTTYIYDGLAIVRTTTIIQAKFRMVTDEGGVWVGSCELPTNRDGLYCVGHGQGIYEGLELHSYPGPNYGNLTSFTGYVIDTRH